MVILYVRVNIYKGEVIPNLCMGNHIDNMLFDTEYNILFLYIFQCYPKPSWCDRNKFLCFGKKHLGLGLSVGLSVCLSVFLSVCPCQNKSFSGG